MARATMQERATTIVLDKFLHICRLRVFGHVSKNQDSMTILAGWMTSGYEKNRLKLNRIFTM